MDESASSWWTRPSLGYKGVDVGTSENAWDVAADVSSGSIIELYRREAQTSDKVITATPLKAAPAWWPDGLFGSWRLQDLREVMLRHRGDGLPHWPSGCGPRVDRRSAVACAHGVDAVWD